MKKKLKNLGYIALCFTIFSCSNDATETADDLSKSSSTDLTSKTPSTLLELDKWKITVPKDDDGDDEADEIYYDDTSQNTIASDGTLIDLHNQGHYYYYKSATNWVNFRADAGDATTGNSDNPRCELREMEKGGDDEIGWDAESSTKRVMTCKFKVVRTPSSKKVCFMQIHGTEDYDGWDDAIRLQVRTSDANASEGDSGTVYVMGGVVDDSADDLFTYTLGETLQMTLVAQNGQIKVYSGTSSGTLLRTYDCDSGKNYFKAGVYLQSKPSSGYGEVAFKSISVTD
jgi:hypothetical protein